MLYNNFLHHKDFILETICGREASDTFKVPRHFQKEPGLKLSELSAATRLCFLRQDSYKNWNSITKYILNA